MGFAFLHRYIFGDQVIYPLQSHCRENDKCSRIYFDCTGLLYQMSYALPSEVIVENTDSLLNLMVDNLKSFIKIVKELTSNPTSIYLFFDGKSPSHKLSLQRRRDERSQRASVAGKKMFGLSLITDRNTRSSIISHIANNIVCKISQECDYIQLFSTDQPGEADIKIVKAVLSSNVPDSTLEIIVTADTDIFISLNSLRHKTILVVIRLPSVGFQCLTSSSLNNWLDINSLCYKRLLFYFVFFCGNDYECPIVSGTKNQVLQIYDFGKKHGFKVSIGNLLRLWSTLNIKPSKSVVITGLSFRVLCQITRIKMVSVTQSIKYYSFGCDLPDNHIMLLPIYDQWRTLFKNINPKDIVTFLRQVHNSETGQLRHDRRIQQ